MRKIHFLTTFRWFVVSMLLGCGLLACFGSDPDTVAEPVPAEEDDDDSDTSKGGSGGQVDPMEVDDDGDGFSENQGDCDDSTGDISPVAVEVP